MSEAVIVDAVRTPIGRYGGQFASVRPDDLGAVVIRKLLKRHSIAVQIEDVYMGCANQAGEDCRNVARMSSLLAGLPVTVPGVTVNRLCGSGLEAVNQAANAIRSGQGSVYVAGGTESMTRAPLVMMKPGTSFARGDHQLVDTTLGWRLVNEEMTKVYPPISLGETAERVAEKYGISRTAQDEFAISSQQKYAQALEEGKFKEEIVPVAVKGRKGTELVMTDEHPRPEITYEKIAKLPPVFREGGTVTAGNSSGLNDGAAALLIMERQKAEELSLRPRVKVIASAVAGVDPSLMGIGPIPATQKGLAQAGLSIDQIDLVEINEAFAAQTLACIQELRIDPAKVNVNGGAIALGHPLGCSGARIMTTLIHEMERRQVRYGLATMCIGVGQGIATIVERVS
ncbi:thiolase family protein [Risungbinella massiliensis]|uniref:thiolase family protein n=1 Tax=Risungbinella massiliensis TaxID=1329796 RepID=UPI0005CBCB71|nr:thiolase family protein [Risungbinella massiliensis]